MVELAKVDRNGQERRYVIFVSQKGLTAAYGGLLAQILTIVIAGLVYKKGKFSAIEEQQLEEAIERYRAVSSARYCSRASLTSE